MEIIGNIEVISNMEVISNLEVVSNMEVISNMDVIISNMKVKLPFPAFLGIYDSSTDQPNNATTERTNRRTWGFT